MDIWQNIKDAQPKFNPIIANGIAVTHFEEADKYIDAVIRITAKSFPEGLEYLGYTHCTPEEELRETKELLNKRRTVELNKSSVRMNYYHFAYKGEKLKPKPLYIPYLLQAGQFYNRGTLNTITPILADGDLSVSKRDIFIAFLANKITFKARQHAFFVDERMINTYVVHGKIHNVSAKNIPHYHTKKDDLTKMEHATALYLFCKFGFFGTVKKYLGIDVYASETGFDEKEFPRDEWSVASATGTQPRTMRKPGWFKTPIQICFRKSDWSQGLEALLGAFYFVTDHYPDRVKIDYLDSINIWRVILSHAIFRTVDGEGKLLDEANKHFISVDNYLDDFTKESLRISGCQANDIYDLFMYLVTNFMSLILNKQVGSMYGKRLVVLRYIFSNIINGINETMFALTSSKRRELKAADINKAFGKYFQADVFFKKRKGKCSSPTQSAGDNIMFSFTAKILSQEEATTQEARKTAGDLNNPEKFLDVSIADIGSILNNRKSDPTGRGDLNPYQVTDATGVIRPNRKFKALLEDIQQKTQHK